MEKKMALTLANIKRLTPPVSGRAIIYDTRVPGFGVRLTEKGSKSLILYRKINDRAQIITLGKVGTLPVEKARKIAERMNGEIAEGVNPMDRRRKSREENTFGGFFIKYMEQHARPHKITWMDDEKYYRRFLNKWASRKLSTIRTEEIVSLHNKIGTENGRPLANRVLATASIIFSKAIEWGDLKTKNPADRVKKFREVSRDRFIQPSEIPRFFEALDETASPHLKDYVLLSLLTGARQGNVLAMRWEQLNIDDAVWTIPETKNGTSQRVPLHEVAIEILNRRREKFTGEWVFPGYRKSETGHYTEPGITWKKLMKSKGMGDLRLHDLRRSLGSYMAATGANISMIGKALNHKRISSTAIYARLNIDPVREAINTAMNAFFVAGDQKESAEIINLPSRRKINGSE